MFRNLFAILFFISTLFLLNSCTQNGTGLISSDLVNNPNTANGKIDASNLPVIKFEEEIHDFHKITAGETVSFTFKFKNIGKSDLLIADVSTSCGCTVPSFSKAPIPSGKEGTIKVAFNSTGKHGFQTKNIVIIANTQPNTSMVRIKAEVVSPGINN
ncbi:MAG: DUF1573 domain-containing protein [Bacteroidota bacterium]